MRKAEFVNMSSPVEFDEDELIVKTAYVSLLKRRFVNKENGYRGAWDLVRVTDGRPVVACLPITQEGDLLLNRIYRMPIKSYSIECVMGLMDADDPHGSATAARELYEETGYIAKGMTYLGSGFSNPGLVENEMHLFLAQHAQKVGEPEREPEEHIDVMRIRFDTAIETLATLCSNKLVRVDWKLFGFITIAKQYLEKLFRESQKERVDQAAHEAELERHADAHLDPG